MSERDLDPLDPDLSRLLAAERSRPREAPDRRARIRLRVEATLGLGPLDGGGGHPDGGADLTRPQPTDLPPDGGLPASGIGAPGAAAGSALGGVTKLVVGGLVAAAFAGAVGASARGGILSPASPGKPSMSAAPALGPSAWASLAAAADAQEAPQTEVISRPPEASPSTSAAAPSLAAPRTGADAEGNKAGRDDSLAAERALLEVARSAVIAGQSAAALSALGQHARAFPRGRLSEEREGLWIRVLIGAGRADEARQRAAHFRKSFPRSMLIPSFEEALGTIP